MRNSESKLRAWLYVAVLLASVKLLAQPQPGTVLWTYDVGRQIVSSPAVGPDGTVYLGTDIAFYAITNAGISGSNKWIFPAGVSAAFTCSPAVGSDGSIYFGDNSSNDTLHALNPDGSERWPIPLQTNFQYDIAFQSTPAIAFDGTIYFAAGDQVYAASPTGVLKWNYPLGGDGSTLSPAVASDAAVYATVSLGRTLHRLSPDGTASWSASLSYGSSGSVAIGREGNIYVTAGLLYAFAPDGTQLWATNVEHGLDGPPVIGAGGDIYACANGTHTLYAFAPSGQLLWQALETQTKGVPSTCAAVDAAGNIYYCISNSVVALNTQGQVLWSVFGGYNGGYFTLCVTSPTIAPDGTLFAAIGSKLYAIATGTNGPANSSWPMFQQNARHTGKIEKPLVSQPQKRSDHNFQFQLYAQLGQTQTVQTSTYLTDWTSLTNITITNVPMDVVDLSASNFLSRFYRVYSQ